MGRITATTPNRRGDRGGRRRLSAGQPLVTASTLSFQIVPLRDDTTSCPGAGSVRRDPTLDGSGQNGVTINPYAGSPSAQPPEYSEWNDGDQARGEVGFDYSHRVGTGTRIGPFQY